MKISELIEKLSSYPPDYRVFVDGYEDGVADLDVVRPVEVKLDVHSEWYYGNHEIIESSDSYARGQYGAPDAVGVYLPRS